MSRAGLDVSALAGRSMRSCPAVLMSQSPVSWNARLQVPVWSENSRTASADDAFGGLAGSLAVGVEGDCPQVFAHVGGHRGVGV